MQQWCRALSLVLALTAPGLAQTSWSTEFCPAEVGYTNQGAVFCSAVLDDGSGPHLIVGGDFTVVNGLPMNRIAGWDGRDWRPLGQGFALPVLAMAAFDEGAGPRLWVAEGTTNGITCTVHQWDGHGWTNRGSTQRITCFEVFDAGAGPRLYAGTSGAFAQHSVRVWQEGVWQPAGAGVYGEIFDLHATTISGEPRMVATGNFMPFTAPPSVSFGIAGFDGSAWQALTNPAVHSTFLYTLEDFGGSLYLGGSFQFVGGQPSSGLAVGDGLSWAPTQSGMHTTRRLHAHDGRLFAAGAPQAGGTGVNSFDGQAWSPAAQSINGDIRSLASFSLEGPEQLFAAGAFTTVEGIPTGAGRALVRFDGERWTRAGRGADARVRSLATRKENGRDVLYAAGDFTAIGAENVAYVARWDEGQWTQVGGGLTPAAGSSFGPVSWLKVLPLAPGVDHLYATGSGFLPSGGAFNGVIRLDETGWTRLGGPTSGFGIEDLATFDAGDGTKLYAAAIGPPKLRVYTGADWEPLPGISSIDGSVRALLTLDDGSGPALFVGGSFTSINGVPIAGLARWDGTSWSPAGAAFGGGVFGLHAIDLGDGPQLYATGPLTAGGGLPTGVARWTGSEWVQVGDGRGPHELAAIDLGSGPVLAGLFRAPSPQGMLGEVRTLESGAWVLRHQFQDPAGGSRMLVGGSNLWLAGEFLRVDGQSSERIARRPLEPCYANCDGSTTDPILNVADFSCFLQKFGQGDTYANCDQSTTNPVLNVADFSCFLQEFAAGCN